MSEHFVKRCECGIIIAQCRCIGPKVEEIVSPCTHKKTVAAAIDTLTEAMEIIDDLVDPDDCEYDHHGYCQAHMWLTTGVCPHARGKAFLKRINAK